MFNNQIVVSGVTVSLRPYTEKRLKDLVAVNMEIQEFITKNPDVTIDQIEGKRAEWYKRKAEILWKSDNPLSIDFFASEDFELSLLKQTEDFFLANRLYL
jgi:hypothetical protein